MVDSFGVSDRTFPGKGEKIRQIPRVRPDRMLREIPMPVKVSQESVYKVLHSRIIGRLEGSLYGRPKKGDEYIFS